jgi:hypothetical protein
VGRSVGAARVFRPVVELDLEAEHEIAPGLAVGVEVQGLVDPALERLVHHEVQAAQMGQLVAPDRAAQQPPELAAQPLRRELRPHRLEVAHLVHPDTDVRAVALVACARMRDLAQHHPPRHVKR